MIENIHSLYALHTEHTSYLFSVEPAGHLEHLYYGPRITCDAGTLSAITPKEPWVPGTSIQYDPGTPSLCMEKLRGEVSDVGKGDFGEPFVELIRKNGARTTDFVVEHVERLTKKPALPGLPSAYGESECLTVTLQDKTDTNLRLILTYGVFADCDCITRSAVLKNETGETITLNRLMSAQLDLPDCDFSYTCFTGSWGNEMNRNTRPLSGVSAFSGSVCGTSANRANPLIFVERPETTETAGDVYAFNLIYSGNHLEIAQCGANDRLRVLCGIHPRGFSWELADGESFSAPEAVLCFSDEGEESVSHRLHRFVREHIVRGTWKTKERPVLLNSWEGCYFNFNETRLLSMAKEAKRLGAELFVMDDGWFGERENDTKGLGDWTVNRKKLPHGLSGLSGKLKEMGLLFGIWVEPEMVNVNSRLYEAHPDWALEIPGRSHSEGRNQRILDLANPAVRDYLFESLSKVFCEGSVAYVKWDMNRCFSDVFAQSVPAARQGETAHRYILGLYELLGRLTEAFPDLLFESCASGGNRADLGMLSYMPQVWASDNTDPICRSRIQNGYSYGYPMSVLGCHVSASPNHQTLRATSIATRYAVAMCGLLGYELEPSDLSEEERKAVAEQIEEYKTLRPWLMSGDYYRLPAPKDRVRWSVVSADKTHAVAVDLQILADNAGRTERIRLKGLDPAMTYRMAQPAKPVDIKPFGGLVNMVSPIRVKPEGMIVRLASRFYHMEGDSVNEVSTGSVFMKAGVALPPPFMGLGINKDTKYYPDFASRIYRIEAEAGEESEK